MTNTGMRREDNRDFVSKLEQGWKKHKDRKDVYISFVVQSIHEVDLPKQRFHALFNYYVAWEEDVENVDIGDDKDKEYEKWNEKMFCKCFDPQIRLTNCIEWNENEREEWFRVVSMDKENHSYKQYDFEDFKKDKKEMKTGEKIGVIKGTRAQGWFEEEFEMADFPVDVQHLHIGVTSRWDHKKVAISYDKFRPSIISSDALASQTYEMCEPRLFSYRDDWETHSQPLLTQQSDSATGAQYCRAYIAIPLLRRSKFVGINVMFIMTMVGFFSFATYAIQPSDLGDRQSVVLTLVLTTVAFKYVTMNMLPEIPYLTMIDIIIIGVMVIQALMLLAICISASIGEEDSQNYFDDCAFIFLGVCWLGLLLWFNVKYAYLYYVREKYLEKCNEFFGEAVEKTNSFKNTDDKDLYGEDHKKPPPTPPNDTRYYVKKNMNRRGIRRRSIVQDDSNNKVENRYIRMC